MGMDPCTRPAKHSWNFRFMEILRYAVTLDGSIFFEQILFSLAPNILEPAFKSVLLENYFRGITSSQVEFANHLQRQAYQIV